MQAGKHKNVKIVEAFLGESKEKKTPYFGIEFENEAGETIEHAFYLTDKTKEKQIKLLAEMGYVGKSLTDMVNPKFKISDLFKAPKEPIELVVIDEEYTNDDGEIKTKQVVQWVNIGQRGGLAKVDHATAIKIFKNTSLDGLLMKEQKNMPKSTEPSNDVPF